MLLEAAGVQWYEITILLLGGGGLTTLILFGLKWIRFNKSDSADTGIKNATAEKLKAEAQEIKAKSDVSVADAALKLAQRLTEECDVTRKQLDKTEGDLNTALNSLRDATIKLNEAQHELKNERQKNIFMTAQIEKLTKDLQELQIANQK